MLNQTQTQFVIKHLLKYKKIDRNFCLRSYVSRLGAIIKKLEYNEWRFDKRGYDESKNYVYYLTKRGLPM